MGSVAAFTTQSRPGTLFFGHLRKSFAAGVINWLHVLDVGFFTKGFDALVSVWDRCLSRGSQYVEKCACLCSMYVKICSHAVLQWRFVLPFRTSPVSDSL
jgi:hypothetical protein